MSINFLRSNTGIKITDSQDDTVVNISNMSEPTQIIVTKSTQQIQIISRYYNKTFISSYIGTINGVSPTQRSPQQIGDQLRDQIFNAASVVTTASTVIFQENEVPSGVINGSNATFTTLYNFDPTSVMVTINGLRQKPTLHFQTSGNTTIILSDSPQVGDILLVDYQRI